MREVKENLDYYFKGNIKAYLKALLRNIGLDQTDLYYKTGFNFEDVETIEQLTEVKRLLGREYYISSNF